jgi:O-glycosyl hydrolase
MAKSAMRLATAVVVAITGVVALSPIAAAAGATATPFAAIAINGGARFQTINGFGSSEGFAQAMLLMNDQPTVRSKVLNLLYSDKTGAGLSILRNSIGSTPLFGTIEPVAPPNPAVVPTYVSIGSDDGQLWLARTVRERYGLTQLVADAWSAPPFMKTNSSDTGGGTLCGLSGTHCASGNWTKAYAEYLVQYLKDYRSQGLPIGYVGFENEPTLATDYSSMLASPRESADFAGTLASDLEHAGLRTRVECCDAEGWNSASAYVRAIESNPATLSRMDLVTSHGYTEAPAAPLPGWTKAVWETEWSTFDTWDPSWDDGTDASGFIWAQHIFNAITRTHVNAFFYWWGSNQEKDDNEGLVRISSTTVSPSGRLWAFAAFSRFVRPGAVRIGATTHRRTLEAVAFQNTSKSVAVVILNSGSIRVPIHVTLSNIHLSSTSNVEPFITDSTSDVVRERSLRVSHDGFDLIAPGRAVITCVLPD